MSFFQSARRSETPGLRKRVLFALLGGLALFVALSVVGAYALLPMLKGNASKLANDLTSPTQCHDTDAQNSTFFGGWNPTGGSNQTDGRQVVNLTTNNGSDPTTGTVYMSLYYCPQYKSVFGRFSYTGPLNSTAVGYCFVQGDQGYSSLDNSGPGCQGLANIAYSGPGSNADSTGGGYMDTQIVPIASNGSGHWYACWGPDPVNMLIAFCTNGYAVPS